MRRLYFVPKAIAHLCCAALLLLLAHSGIVAGHAAASCADVDPLTVLPTDQPCPDWQPEGAPQTASNIEELTEIINGGAYLFEEYGFTAAAFQDYAGQAGGADVLIEVGVFNQGTQENAQALYNDPDSPGHDAEPIEEWGGSGEARMRVSFGFVYLQFWEDCFFVWVIASAGGDEAVPGSRCLADSVVELIQGATPTLPWTWGRIRAAFR